MTSTATCISVESVYDFSMPAENGTTIAQDAEAFAGLDTERVFTDLAAGRFIYGGDVIAAAEQVKQSHPEHTEDLDKLIARARTTGWLWD